MIIQHEINKNLLLRLRASVILSLYNKFTTSQMGESMRIWLVAVVFVFVGCASAPVVKTHNADKAVVSEKPAESKVMSAIRKMLESGANVAVMIDCNSSCAGIPQGQLPEEYGCTADKETAADVEKYMLLEAFESYPNFSLVDRSKMDDSIKEIRLSMNGTTSRALEPGQFSGATHLLMIDSRDMLVRSGGRIQDRYIATKKLLDLQKNVLVAMDKINEKHDVTYQPMLAEREAPHQTPERPAMDISSPPPAPQNSQPVEPVNEPNVKPNEVIAIYGQPQPPQPEPVYARPFRVDVTPQRSNMQSPEETPVNAQAETNNERTVIVRNYVSARILKQRLARLRNVDERVIARRINANNRNINANNRNVMMDRLRSGIPTPPH